MFVDELGKIFDTNQLQGNIANMVVATDTNLRSVLQYAVDVLQVRHIIVTGWRLEGNESNATRNVEKKQLNDQWMGTHTYVV